MHDCDAQRTNRDEKLLPCHRGRRFGVCNGEASQLCPAIAERHGLTGPIHAQCGRCWLRNAAIVLQHGHWCRRTAARMLACQQVALISDELCLAFPRCGSFTIWDIHLRELQQMVMCVLQGPRRMTLLFQGGWCLYALRLRDKWSIRVAMREADKVGAGCDDDSCVKVTRENYRSMSAYCNVGYDECSSIKILSDDCGYANAREVCAQPMPCGNDRCELLGLVPEVRQGDSAPCSNVHGSFADVRGSFQLLKRDCGSEWTGTWPFVQACSHFTHS